MAKTRELNYVLNRCKYTYDIENNVLTTTYDNGKTSTENVTDNTRARLVRIGIPRPIVESLLKPKKE